MSQVMPVFVFGRRRQIETETGLTLAGILIDQPPLSGPDRMLV
jgi:hypothetical protein